MTKLMKVEQINQAYGNQEVLKEIDFFIEKGESLGIIGPNGSGKTTLLNLLSTLTKAKSGNIYYQNRKLNSYSAKEYAQSVAVLQQDALPAIDFNVRQVVEMGRYPFQNWLGEEEKPINILIDQVLEKMALVSLQDRELSQLSGGERQRVALAKIMVQEPRLVLLDEPTTYLDIGHQIQLMDEIQAWQEETNLTVVSVLHDLNLAALYCERLILLDQGRIVKVGTPTEVITEEMIEKVYGIRPLIVEHPSAKVPQVILEGDSKYFQKNK